MYIALEHKHYAMKFFLAWMVFAVADALWLDTMSGWLKLLTHGVLLLAAILSVIFWVYRIWKLHHGHIGNHPKQE